MVVSIDKPTTVKMYDKVRKYWSKYIRELREKLEGVVEGRDALIDRLAYMEETDMAVVVSGEQNEIEKFRRLVRVFNYGHPADRGGSCIKHECHRLPFQCIHKGIEI